MDLVIRETAETDVDALFDVRARTRENAASRETLAAMGISPASTLADLRSGAIKGWVCVDGDGVVGFCSASSDGGEVLVLAVLPEYEGRGIGSQLLSHAVRWLRSRGTEPIWLAASSNESCRAYGFYRSLGWRPTGARQQNGDEILVQLER